jgi:hypothetical protein
MRRMKVLRKRNLDVDLLVEYKDIVPTWENRRGHVRKTSGRDMLMTNHDLW